MSWGSSDELGEALMSWVGELGGALMSWRSSDELGEL